MTDPRFVHLSPAALVNLWRCRLTLDSTIQSGSPGPEQTGALHVRLLELEAQAAEALTGGLHPTLQARVRRLANVPESPIAEALIRLCDTLEIQAAQLEDYRTRALDLDSARAAMSSTLQAIAEAFPSDLRYDADLAGTVRTLVRDLGEAHHRLRSVQDQSAQAAEAHLGELQELRAAHDKAEQDRKSVV